MGHVGLAMTNNRPRSPARRFHALAAGLIALVAVNAAVFFGDRFTQGQCYIVIHSDDAGMYTSVNRATIDALESRAISSCSVMVPCPAFDDFAEYARRHPEKDYGVHLTLNCDTPTHRWGPVLSALRVPSLVGPDGCLWSTTEKTAQRASLAEVEAELRAQIDKARASGIRVSHLDHHMFVLFRRADFVRLYVKLGLDYDLPIRYMETTPIYQLNPDNQAVVEAYQEGLKALEARGMPIFQEIDSRNYRVSAGDKREYFLGRLNSVKPGVTEFLIHCGYAPAGAPHAPDAERREEDTHVFMSQEMRDAIVQRGITVIDWKRFRTLYGRPQK
jgi:chitin disaccharide deacetylase